MRMNYVLQNCFTRYKIEKWNEEKDSWEYFTSSNNYLSIRRTYDDLLFFGNGIYRLIIVKDIDEVHNGS